jgi:hypothetical protein
VKVVRVSLEQAKIDFVLVDPPRAWLRRQQDADHGRSRSRAISTSAWEASKRGKREARKPR